MESNLSYRDLLETTKEAIYMNDIDGIAQIFSNISENHRFRLLIDVLTEMYDEDKKIPLSDRVVRDLIDYNTYSFFFMYKFIKLLIRNGQLDKIDEILSTKSNDYLAVLMGQFIYYYDVFSPELREEILIVIMIITRYIEISHEVIKLLAAQITPKESFIQYDSALYFIFRMIDPTNINTLSLTDILSIAYLAARTGLTGPFLDLLLSKLNDNDIYYLSQFDVLDRPEGYYSPLDSDV